MKNNVSGRGRHCLLFLGLVKYITEEENWRKIRFVPPWRGDRPIGRSGGPPFPFRGYGSVVECVLPKDEIRVRFPLPAPSFASLRRNYGWQAIIRPLHRSSPFDSAVKHKHRPSLAFFSRDSSVVEQRTRNA